VYTWRLVLVTRSGQKLIGAIKAAKKRMDDFLIRNPVDPDPRHSLRILEERLANRSPISPGSSFRSRFYEAVSSVIYVKEPNFVKFKLLI
jgi:hypothetical protein